MTLIKRYAIEPAALRRWEDFRYVMEKMSFSDGKVLVAFPKKWIKDFLDGLGQIGDIERQRFVTKLQRYKEDRMIESGSPYFKKLQWVDNALRVIKENKVEAVLVSELTKTKNSTLSLPTPADVDEEFFSGAREIRCSNTADNLLEPAKIFLESSVEAIFIDPYFKITSLNCLHVLNEFVRYSTEATYCFNFIIYTSCDFMPKGGYADVSKYFDNNLSRCSCKGFKILINFISNETSKQSFHARYLLTQRGELRYDKGFQIGNPPVLVDISLLDKNMHYDLYSLYFLYSLYSEKRADLKINESFTWTAK